MSIYKFLFKPLLFQMDPEEAHCLVHRLACSVSSASPLLKGLFGYPGVDLETELAGMRLKNPIGMAAGFDKNAMLVEMLGNVGFGFVEIGSVTARPTAGNPRPRLFRLPLDEALINRMGLNGDGADRIAKRLSTCKLSLPVGLNIAKTNDPAIQGDAAVEDILYTFNKVKDLPVSYITINASCPNTAEGKLAERRDLAVVFREIQRNNRRSLPILVKLSPDSSEDLIESVAQSAREFGLAGYVCGNTSTSRQGLRTPGEVITGIGSGGLSGRPIKPLALKLCRYVHKLKGSDQAIIAVGGIRSGQDAYDFLRSGASAFELYTGLVYEGPMLPRKINAELSNLLARDRMFFKDAIGMDVV